MLRPTTTVNRGQTDQLQRLLTLGAGRQPAAVPINHRQTFVYADERSSQMLGL